MLKRSIELDPGYALTWAHLGRALTANASFELGGREQYRDAQAAYEKASALQPAPIEALIYLANLFTDTGQVERGVPLLRDALDTNPNHAEVHWELGYAYRFGGMLKESVAECERARQVDPSVKLGSSALNAYLYLGQYDRFLASLPNDAGSPLILFYRGFGEYHKKDLEAAARDFDAAFELRPSVLAGQNRQGLERRDPQAAGTGNRDPARYRKQDRSPWRRRPRSDVQDRRGVRHVGRQAGGAGRTALQCGRRVLFLPLPGDRSAARKPSRRGRIPEAVRSRHASATRPSGAVSSSGSPRAGTSPSACYHEG